MSSGDFNVFMGGAIQDMEMMMEAIIVPLVMPQDMLYHQEITMFLWVGVLVQVLIMDMIIL